MAFDGFSDDTLAFLAGLSRHNDKVPYKDHLDLWFWEGETRKAAESGFFFRLKADYFALGMGAHQVDASVLKRYRDLVIDRAANAALLSAVRKVEKAGYPVQGERYKKLPKGFTEESVPGGELGLRLLRHNALFAADERTLNGATKTLVQGQGLVDHCAAVWKEMLPLHRWLVDNLQ